MEWGEEGHGLTPFADPLDKQRLKEVYMEFTADPLAFFLDKYGYDALGIKEMVSGSRYTAVLLQNGHIGVCANLQNNVKPSLPLLAEAGVQPDLTDICHRIVFTAYLNACHNYQGFDSREDDIWNVLDFSNGQRIIMVGLFKPIVRKFEKAGIPLSVFDLVKADSALTEMALMHAQLKQADSVILTATSVFNGTFLKTLDATPDACRIYLLGPSAIMVPEMLAYRNVKMIFGATFKKDDQRVLQVIREDGGTRQFLKFGGKNCLTAD